MGAPSSAGFCRRCGSAARWGIPTGDNRDRAICDSCGFVEYDNPKIVVSCALYSEDRILWVRRLTPPYAGGCTP